ncbi:MULTISPECIES: hypothetical protein [Saccharothrix]|uniref:hypothetical protein n=1 Tax=Saccharothrix TaxID=2071 RepID=UPI00093EA7F2|nr:hypothetical protein [Saccharothrix sp. CB00851]OKI19848.1 hypothetical protein A6A25_38880 [Saccharothrix sp. CB00851]
MTAVRRAPNRRRSPGRQVPRNKFGPSPRDRTTSPEARFNGFRDQPSPGTKQLADSFTAAGYAVTLPHHVDRELGVLIVSEAAPFEYDFYRDLTRYHTPTPPPT